MTLPLLILESSKQIISSQLHSNSFGSLGRDVVVPPKVGRDCSAVNILSPLTSASHSNHLAALSSLSLPWIYAESVQPLSLVVDSLFRYEQPFNAASSLFGFRSLC